MSRPGMPFAAAGGDGWLTHGRDYGNTRYAPQAEIDAGSVGRLAPLWTFDAPGSFRDSARWPDAWRRGGAPVWSTPAYDPAAGLLFVSTGNPSRVDGAIPPGDNLHSTSLLALDAATGALRWHHQMLPHNLWDLDASGPPVLLDMVVEGETVPAVAHTGKTGWVHFLDRRTGLFYAFGDADGWLSALDARTGETRWRRSPRGGA